LFVTERPENNLLKGWFDRLKGR